ncbi:MAG: hypothetical protein QOG30_3202 [Acidimicrobiaceae bacterium]
MKPDHPFETPGLDEVRAEQRRALRLIPTYIFAEHAPTIGPDVTNIADVDRPLIETSLRAEAKTLLGDLSSLLDGWHDHTRTEVLDHFYQQNRTRAEHMDAPRQTAFADESDKARAAHRATDRTTPRVEDAPALRRLLFLLVWADGLTAYRDPRLDNEPALPTPEAVGGRIGARGADGATPLRDPADDDATQLLAPQDVA